MYKIDMSGEVCVYEYSLKTGEPCAGHIEIKNPRLKVRNGGHTSYSKLVPGDKFIYNGGLYLKTIDRSISLFSCAYIENADTVRRVDVDVSLPRWAFKALAIGAVYFSGGVYLKINEKQGVNISTGEVQDFGGSVIACNFVFTASIGG